MELVADGIYGAFAEDPGSSGRVQKSGAICLYDQRRTRSPIEAGQLKLSVVLPSTTW
jgi:hypothetical protein